MDRVRSRWISSEIGSGDDEPSGLLGIGKVPFGGSEGGVLGVLPGIVGCLQASEAIKLILGIGDPMIGRLLHFDALSFRFREIKLRRDPECAVCGEKPTIQELKEIVFNCDMSDLTLREIDVHQLKARLDDPKP